MVIFGENTMEGDRGVPPRAVKDPINSINQQLVKN